MKESLQDFLHLLFLIGITLVIFFYLSLGIYPICDGEREWFYYDGILLEFDIDCEECCHPSSGFKIYDFITKRNHSHLIMDCDKNLEDIMIVGNRYQIKLEPCAEPYAITRSIGEPSCHWCVHIDYVKYEGSVIYGWEWF